MTPILALILAAVAILAAVTVICLMTFYLTNRHNLRPQPGATRTAGKGEPCKEQVVEEHHFKFEPYKYRYIWWQNDPDDPRNKPDY